MFLTTCFILVSASAHLEAFADNHALVSDDLRFYDRPCYAGAQRPTGRLGLVCAARCRDWADWVAPDADGRGRPALHLGAGPESEYLQAYVHLSTQPSVRGKDHTTCGDIWVTGHRGSRLERFVRFPNGRGLAGS
jgi:hypothetical protein